MDSKKIFYLELLFLNESDAWNAGIRTQYVEERKAFYSLVLAVADDEATAIQNMEDYLVAKNVIASVNVPTDATEDVGHGILANEYFTDPKHRPLKWREVIDAYVNRYVRYEIQVLDERGEILAQNDYTHPEDFIPPPQPPKNVFVPLELGEEDELESGIAFVADETAEDSQGWAVTAEKITDEDGNITIMQCRYMADGRLETRQRVNGVWTEWVHVYTEEVPAEKKYFLRTYDPDTDTYSWSGYTWDNAPKSGSKQLVNSGAVYTWVRNEISKMYEMCGTATVAELNTYATTFGVAERGNVYNVTDSGTLTWTEDGVAQTADVNPGDNLLWTGSGWDSLAHFINADLYVKYTDQPTSSKSGAVKVNTAYGISAQSQILRTVAASKAEISSKNNNYRVIVPSNLDNAVAATTHQEVFENDEDVELTTASAFTEKAALPISLAAARQLKDDLKNYADSKIHPETGGMYQPLHDDNLQTEAKTVVAAINEVANKMSVVSTQLNAGNNTVLLGKKYPLSWQFVGAPFCFTSVGTPVDFQLSDFINHIEEDQHAFTINVPVECRLHCAVAASSAVLGVPVQYAVVSYRYTASSGKDLDTVTAIMNEHWEGNKTVGYGHSSAIQHNGKAVVQFGGDNTGNNGTSIDGTTYYYESLFLDINALAAAVPNEDITLQLYGMWYNRNGGDGNIEVLIDTYTGENVTPKVNSSTKIVSLEGDNIVTTFSASTPFSCILDRNKPATGSNFDDNYETYYRPVFKIVLKATGGQNRDIQIIPLT